MSKLTLITCVLSCFLTFGLIANNAFAPSTANSDQFACSCHDKNKDKNKKSSNLAGCPCKDKNKEKKPVTNDCRDCGIV